jgi:hypothetical protein
MKFLNYATNGTLFEIIYAGRFGTLSFRAYWMNFLRFMFLYSPQVLITLSETVVSFSTPFAPFCFQRLFSVGLLRLSLLKLYAFRTISFFALFSSKNPISMWHKTDSAHLTLGYFLSAADSVLKETFLYIGPSRIHGRNETKQTRHVTWHRVGLSASFITSRRVLRPQ